MAAPQKGSNLTNKLRAYELYAMGAQKSEIARQIGVTRMTIGNWAKQERWDERLAGAVAEADKVANHATSDVLAFTLIRLKSQLVRRINELEGLCGPSSHPATRIKAITLWCKLAGVDRALPDPTTPTDPRSLELIEDLSKES